MYRKDIRHDAETNNYAMYLDEEFMNYARTYHEAEVTLDQLILTRSAHTQLPPPASLWSLYHADRDAFYAVLQAWTLDQVGAAAEAMAVYFAEQEVAHTTGTEILRVWQTRLATRATTTETTTTEREQYDHAA